MPKYVELGHKGEITTEEILRAACAAQDTDEKAALILQFIEEQNRRFRALTQKLLDRERELQDAEGGHD